MQQKVVNLIGENELLKLDALFLKRLGESYGLFKRNIAIVISMNQKNRGTPGLDGGERRGIPGEAGHIGASLRVVGRNKVADYLVPIVDTVKIHTRCKQIGSARQSERCEVATVAAAPKTDPPGID